MTLWCYGVTTCSKRLSSGLLERTLKSLEQGGFPRPRLFIDGIPNVALPDFAQQLEVTCRNPPIRVYGNLYLGLSELFIRSPAADMYAMFQDDMVTYKNLRLYLECCNYPDKGYLNLYTFPENEKPVGGFYLSNQLGKGAVALVFSNAAMKTLLTNTFWICRPSIKHQNPDRAWKFVDGGIVEAMKQQGYKEYVHNPSLVQHTGLQSTVGNARQQLARTFRGEGFDALSMVKKRNMPPDPAIPEQPSRTPRIGLVSFPDQVAIKIATEVDLYRWLIRPHPVTGLKGVPDDLDFISCPVGQKVEQFVKDVDVVVYYKAPPYDNLLKWCERHNKRVVCLPREAETREHWLNFEEELL